MNTYLFRGLAGICAATLLLLQMGCAQTNYGANRSRDLADIFTCCIGAGGGAKVRLGPAQVAAINHADMVGLRAGVGFVDGNNLLRNEDNYAVLPRLAAPNWDDEAVQTVFKEGKGSVYDLRGRDTLIHSPMYQDRWHSAFGHEFFDPGPGSYVKERRKAITARSGIPFYTQLLDENPAYYSQLEVAVGLGLTIRLGFNPGELIDFLIGFASMDLYGDDL